MANMRLRSGVNLALEEQANDLLRDALRGVPHGENDVLTPWKETDRRKHEVYVASGTPDPAVRRGVYHRAYNRAQPELNSRDGFCRPRRFEGNSDPYEEDWGAWPSALAGWDPVGTE